MSTGDWKTLSCDAFEIDIPSTASLSDADGATTIAFDTAPLTELIIAAFPVPPCTGTEELEQALEGRVRYFIQSCIPVPDGTLIQDWRGRTWTEAGLTISEALALHDEDWWFVRAYGTTSSRAFYLLHWNGPNRYLKDPVLRVFESFQPNFGSPTDGSVAPPDAVE